MAADRRQEPLGPGGVPESDGRAPRPGAGERPEHDAAVVAAAVRGEPAAFEEIVRTHAGLVLSIGRRMLGTREAAEDLMQDVFIKVHRALPDFRGEASLKSFIARIAVNTAHNRRRDDSRRLRVVAPWAPRNPDGDAPELADIAADTAPGPDRLALSSAARARVEAALQAMPDEFRDALVLREIEGLSYEEIGEALGVAPGTVKSRLARARLRMQEALGDLVGGGWP